MYDDIFHDMNAALPHYHEVKLIVTAMCFHCKTEVKTLLQDYRISEPALLVLNN